MYKCLFAILLFCIAIACYINKNDSSIDYDKAGQFRVDVFDCHMDFKSKNHVLKAQNNSIIIANYNIDPIGYIFISNKITDFSTLDNFTVLEHETFGDLDYTKYTFVTPRNRLYNGETVQSKTLKVSFKGSYAFKAKKFLDECLESSSNKVSGE